MKACERGHSECARVILSHPSANPNKHDKVLLLIIETRSLFMQCYFPNIVALACVRLLNVNITGTGPPHGADNSSVQRLYRGGASHPVRQGSESQHARQGTCIFSCYLHCHFRVLASAIICWHYALLLLTFCHTHIFLLLLTLPQRWRTALMWAAARGHTQIEREIKDYPGVDITLEDSVSDSILIF